MWPNKNKSELGFWMWRTELEQPRWRNGRLGKMNPNSCRVLHVFCVGTELTVALHVVAQTKQIFLLHSAKGHSRNGGVKRPVLLPFLALTFCPSRLQRSGWASLLPQIYLSSLRKQLILALCLQHSAERSSQTHTRTSLDTVTHLGEVSVPFVTS